MLNSSLKLQLVPTYSFYLVSEVGRPSVGPDRRESLVAGPSSALPLAPVPPPWAAHYSRDGAGDSRREAPRQTAATPEVPAAPGSLGAGDHRVRDTRAERT